jgi:sugar transferase (PEP-CTERM system associated)
MSRLFSLYIPVFVLVLLASDFLFVTSSFILASYLVLEVDPTVFLFYDGGLTRIFTVVVSVMLALHFQDLYNQIKIRSRFVLIQQLCLVMGIAFVIQGLISYANANARMPIRIMLLGSAIAMVALFFWRWLYSGSVLGVVGMERILFIGESRLIRDISDHIAEHPELGLAVTGHVGCRDELVPPGAKCLGAVSALREIAHAVHPDRIVVGMTERRDQMPIADLLALRFEGYVIEEAPSAYENVCGRISTQELRPSQLIFSGELGPRPNALFFQRLGHLVMALFCLVLFLPVMLLVAVAVKLSSPGEILYRQRRVGRDGAVFTLYKFRSMQADAEAETGIVWASKDDPRVTKVGKFLRRMRLDELPQFFNVLRGEMSIVGPRPERPEFVQALSEQIPYYRQRHCVRPGITGWAQINHKYGDTLEDTVKKLEYDLYYIKHMSQAFDSYIMFHTVKAMLLSRGAQ